MSVWLNPTRKGFSCLELICSFQSRFEAHKGKVSWLWRRRKFIWWDGQHAGLNPAAELLCYLLWHTCSPSKQGNVGLRHHTPPTCVPVRRHTWMHTDTHAHTDHLTGKTLACYACWHGLKVYVTVCVPLPVFVCLMFSCQSPPWQ